MNDFYGKLSMHVVGDNEYLNGNQIRSIGKVRWVVRDDTKINFNTVEIEEGDLLEVFDNMGRTVFRKQIFRDFESFFNPTHKRQIYKGTTVEWLPYGVDAGYWFNLFANGYRAKLVKNINQCQDN